MELDDEMPKEWRDDSEETLKRIQDRLAEWDNEHPGWREELCRDEDLHEAAEHIRSLLLEVHHRMN